MAIHKQTHKFVAYCFGVQVNIKQQFADRKNDKIDGPTFQFIIYKFVVDVLLANECGTPSAFVVTLVDLLLEYNYWKILIDILLVSCTHMHCSALNAMS